MFLRKLISHLFHRSYVLKTVLAYDGPEGPLYMTKVHSFRFHITCNGFGTTKEQSQRNAFQEYNRLLDVFRKKGVLN